MDTGFSNAQRAEVLTQALPYIKHYNGQIVVAMIGEEANVKRYQRLDGQLWLLPEKKQLRRQMGKLGPETVYQILSLQQADNSSKGTEKSGENETYLRILEVLEEIRSEDGCLSLKDLSVNGYDLMEIGFTGRAIGRMLNWLLEQVMEETLPNERSVLLAWAQQVWTDAWQGS